MRSVIRQLLVPALAAGAVLGAAEAFTSASPAETGQELETATLPLGTWEMNVNGRQRTLTIHGVGPAGELDARMQNTAEVEGEWDAEAHRLRFTRIIDPKDRSRDQDYTGYLLDDDPEHSDTHHYMAGSFTYTGPASTPARQVYGWFARIPR